ncbi:TPA: DUF262 domain-containing protein [Vibrio parahaemolyticus]|nr:DUF262 domain-containing protein [Vibrio parahaemolyticus]EGR1726875.1 DUF262 domain-containing protein [Vibrio parahaemolyticus]
MELTKYQSLFRNLGNDSLLNYSRNDIRVNYHSNPVHWYLNNSKDGNLEWNSDFQRKSGVWNNIKKSRFIESIIMHLPITPVFLSQKDDYSFEIIDGLQRLSTLKDFVNDHFPLSGMEFYPELNGLKYSQLPREAGRMLLACNLPCSILLPGADELIKVKIFHRVNTSGASLTPHETRSALYFKTYFYKKLKEATTKLLLNEYNLNDNRGSYQELILTVISMSIFGMSNFKNESSLSDFLDESMRILSSLNRAEIDEIFEKLEYSHFEFKRNFGEYNPFINKRNKFTKAIYLSVMKLILSEGITRNVNVDIYFNLIHSDEFLKLTTSGSSKYNAIKKRDEILRKAIC